MIHDVKNSKSFAEIMGEEKDESYARVGRVTTESVHKCTGKHWKQWVAILDKVGARSWTHQEIVKYLAKKHKLGPWWQQGVTVGYELAIGRRIEGQTAKGTYALTATKSLHVSAAAAWKILVSPKGQDAWLKSLTRLTIKPKSQFETKDGYFGEIRTMLKERRLRFSWQHPEWEKRTFVTVMLVPKPNEKSILAFNHDDIKSEKIQAELRVRWKAAVEAIAKLCASS